MASPWDYIWKKNPIKKGVEDLFDPGKDERKEAQQLDQAAISQAKTGYGQIPGYDSRYGFTRQDPAETQLEYGTDVLPFDVGDSLEIERMRAAEAGPSAYEDIGSAYGELGPSAFHNLGVAREGRDRLNRMGGYFEELTKDPIDAIAEAEYARREAEAEQMRRANSEAALRELEARGMGGGGQQILAELANAQGSASDQYQAGLDVNATAQARRDAAAQTAGEIGRNLWGEDARQAEARAAGKDTFAVNKASGDDAFSTTRAGGLDTAAERQAQREQEANRYGADVGNKAAELNWQRTNDVGDRNVSAQNTLNWWNRIGAPQKAFDNYMDVTRASIGATSGAAGGYRSDAEDEFAWGPWIANQASNLSKAGAK